MSHLQAYQAFLTPCPPGQCRILSPRMTFFVTLSVLPLFIFHYQFQVCREHRKDRKRERPAGAFLQEMVGIPPNLLVIESHHAAGDKEKGIGFATRCLYPTTIHLIEEQSSRRSRLRRKCSQCRRPEFPSEQRHLPVRRNPSRRWCRVSLV
jgi:hypothetical protein